ncbi:MAG: DUF4286 family protein [Paludibacteraceae bacterium]|nr:DUF4286 family protein [Paludibacteraceae bacterium]
MQIYNTTYVVEQQSLDDFLRWLSDEHHSVVNAFGGFSDCVVSRVLTDTGMSGISISVQLFAPDAHTIQQWLDRDEKTLHTLLSKRFGSQVLFFSTLMEKIDVSPKS